MAQEIIFMLLSFGNYRFAGNGPDRPQYPSNFLVAFRYGIGVFGSHH